MISINAIIFSNYKLCEVYRSHPCRHGYPSDIRPPDRGFSRQESGLGLQDILSEKTWKLKKKIAGIIFTSGEKGNICFFFVFFFSFFPSPFILTKILFIGDKSLIYR